MPKCPPSWQIGLMAFPSCCQIWTRVFKFPAKSKRGSRICLLSRNRFPALIPANLRQRSRNRFGANKPRGYRESNIFCSYLPFCWVLPFLFPQHNPIGLQWKRLQPNPLGTDCFWRLFNIFLIQGDNFGKHSLRFQIESLSVCIGGF